MSTMVQEGTVRRRRRRFGREFKEEAVRLVLDGDRTVGAVPASST